ncbi:MAG: hypothetical protein H5T59_03865 [Anaerolineae bacterium]|nr:hypothetical protein [Anaerolineae bacterium]
MGVDPAWKDALLAALERVGGRRVVVLGDLYLDEYVVGRAVRLSREAPVPVLEWERRFLVPGGAANPAHNVVALGAQAEQVGVVGDDPEGCALVAELERLGVGTRGVLVVPGRPTTNKMRVLAQGALRFPQQVVRVDRQERAPVPPEVEASLRERLQALLADADALLVSDYRSGVVTEGLAEAALRETRGRGLLATVDSQGNLDKFRGYDLIKCNRGEAEAILGFALASEETVREGATALLRRTGAAAVVVTLGPEGLALAAGGGYWRLPAVNRTEVFDVTGAGDTVIALATLGRLAGLDWPLAAALANYGAGLVVRKLGNATPTVEELRWAIAHW